MMPGTSRSAASIIGGMTQGLPEKQRQNFLLPCCSYHAGGNSIFCFCKNMGKETPNPQKGYEMIMASQDHIMIFIIGNIVAFIVALIAIKAFIGVLNKYGFRPWGWYRIFVGVALLIYFYFFK
jgi:undecaprenyl-diphosphatase